MKTSYTYDEFDAGGWFEGIPENKREKILKEFNEMMRWKELYYNSEFPDIKSQYLTKIYNSLISGEKNVMTDFMNLNLKFDDPKIGNIIGLIIDKLKNDEYFLNIGQYKNPTEDKIKETNEIYEKFVTENVESTDNLLTESDVIFDDLLNVLSEYSDNNNPCPLLLFAETFDNSLLNSDIDIKEKFENAINSHGVHNACKEYLFWRNIIIGFENKNKYTIARYLENTNKLLDLYIAVYNSKIDKPQCFKILLTLLEEVYTDLDIFDFLKKYIDGYDTYLRNNRAYAYGFQKENPFPEMFIEQYLRMHKMRKEIKLF